MSSNTAYQELGVLQQIAQATDQVFFMYNMDSGKIEYINEQFQTIWHKSGEYINEYLPYILSTVHPEDLTFVELGYRQLVSGAKSKTLEFRLLMPDQPVTWVSLQAYPIIQEGNVPFIAGFVDDITARKERENSANKFSAKKNTILEILSHEIKGALGIIEVINDRIQAQAKIVDNKKMQEYTQVIKGLCQHNAHLIRSLLSSEFIESAEIVLVRKRFNLVTMLETLLSEYKQSARDLRRHFHCQYASKQVYVELDEVLFAQVLNNLISNAVKFTHESGNIYVRIEEKPNSVLICVQDDGIGIPKGLQATIFDRFTKARREGLHGEESVGLGMSIIKRIVELHQGKVWLESEENQGSSFFVEIEKNLNDQVGM
jgi:two-component system sensor histidine kinase VicK